MNIAKLALGLAFGLLSLSPASASAPMVKAQAPGFYRLMLGDFEVTALNDGVVSLGTDSLRDATPEQIRSGMAEMHLSDPVGISYNVFLINTGSKLILIDTGTGGKLGDVAGFKGAGRALANLRAAGYRPEQVDEIYITHIGPDHVGALTTGTERTFPNAIVRAARKEIETFVDPAKSAAMEKAVSGSEQGRIFYRFWKDVFEPYLKAGRIEMFDGDVPLAAGIRTLATPGHTQGHTSYVVESKGKRLIVMGDLVIWGSVQFPYPAVQTNFDADPKAAAVQRERIFDLAAEQDSLVAGSHLSFPGVGHVRKGNGRYFWIPENYTIPD